MKYLKKMSAVILSAALLFTSMTAVSADVTGTTPNAEYASTLRDLGLYSGQDANDPYYGLENALTTQDSLIFLAKLFGYFDTATALAYDEVAEGLAKFDDVDSIAEYAKGVVAYSAANGILNGMTDGEKYFVGANDTVTAARFATFMLKQMGYNVADYKLSVARLAETEGSKVDATLTGDLTRDDAVGTMYGALTAEKANGRKVIEDIIGDNADLREKAEKAGLLTPTLDTEELTVSVRALNCKQIAVEFNQPMDRDSVESESFYEIYDKGDGEALKLGENSASLSDDRKTVVITLNNKVDDKLTNASKAKVILKKGILSIIGEGLAEDAKFDVEVQDGIIPTVEKVEATGEKNIRITFSEPVYDNGYDTGDEKIIKKENFMVTAKKDNKVYGYEVDRAILDNNVIDLYLGTVLIDGAEVEVTVNNAGLDNKYRITDYAGYAVFKSTVKFEYKRDTSVSVVTVRSASRGKVVLGFSKPVKGTNIKLYHSVKNAENYKATATTTDYADEITFTYDIEMGRGLPDGNNKLFLANSDIDSEKLVDGYGVKVPDQTLTCVVETDDIAPVFISGKFYEDKSVDLRFDEKLNEEFAKKTENYEVRKVNGNRLISFSTEIVKHKENTITLNFDPRLEDNTEYKVLIKKAQDVRGNETTRTFTYTFTTGDTKPPVVIEDIKIDQHCYTIAHDGKIFIVYSEPMNEAQMLDKNNYMVSLDGGMNYNFLGDHDSVAKVDDKTVVIYVKELDNKNDPYIRPYVKIAPIMDLSTKRLYGSIDTYTVKSISGVYPATVTVKSAKENKVVLGFSKPVKGSRMKLYYNNGFYMAEAASTAFTNEITFTFDRLLPFGSLELTLKNSEIEDERLVDQDGIKVPDQILRCEVAAPPSSEPQAPADTTPPVVMDYKLNWNESITIKFNERLSIITAEDPANYAVNKLPGNEEIPFTVSAERSGKTVELIFNYRLEENTAYQLLVKKCRDASGNTNTSVPPYSFTTPEIAEIEQAQLIAVDKIKVVFTKKMASIDENDFVVIATTTGAINVVGYEPPTEDPAGRTEVVLNLDNAAASDAKDDEGNVIRIGTIAAPASLSESGGALKPLSGLELVDKVAPEIVMLDRDNDIKKVIVS